MDNKLSRSLSIGRWLLVAILLPNLAIADECPGPGASLTTVRIAISDFQRNDRAPAGADCAYNLATNYPLDPSNLNSTVLSFFSEAADIQRKAAAKRLAAHRTDDGYKYLDQEIALRRDFLKVALENDSTTGETAQELHRYVVRHLSYLISALAERGQYDKVADESRRAESKSDQHGGTPGVAAGSVVVRAVGWAKGELVFG